LPSLIGRKSDKEKFAGAEYTISMEFYMPNGKMIQGPDFHHDGQHFSKAYGIKFLDKDGKEKFAWQNTFAISTRMLGVMFAVHSDSKGLILPPNVSPIKIVVVPILFDDSKEKVLKFAKEIAGKLGEGVFIDAREEHKPGYKFNEWELKGVPLRIEIGPRDLETKKVVFVRRDNGNKESVAVKDVKRRASEILTEIQHNLFDRAKKKLFSAIVNIGQLKDLKIIIANKKIGFAPLCSFSECEERLKFESKGVKVLNIPEEQPRELAKTKCIICSKKADYFCYVGKSY